MNIEKYTERARGFIQSSKSFPMREGLQQFSPLPMLKGLLDAGDSLADGLMDLAGENALVTLVALRDRLASTPRASRSGTCQGRRGGKGLLGSRPGAGKSAAPFRCCPAAPRTTRC